MEEAVGKLWHRWITGLASQAYTDARVQLSELDKQLGIYFRALGGDTGINICASVATQTANRGGWLRRVAYAQDKIELTWLDQESLHLPAQIAVFPDRQDNHALYFWLTALAAQDCGQDLPWFNKNQQLCQKLLQRYPGLKPRYQQLCQAQIKLWQADQQIEAKYKQSLIQALTQPNSISCLPTVNNHFCPVYLWLHPNPPNNLSLESASTRPNSTQNTKRPQSKKPQDTRRRQAERVDSQDSKSGLLAFRLESLFSLAEYVNVDRTCDDEQDLSQAEQALDDIDKLSISRDQEETQAATLAVDLELSRIEDNSPLTQTPEAIYFPEWHYRKSALRPDYCCLNQHPPHISEDASADIPVKLRPFARKLRQQFAALQPQKVWYNGQEDGCEIDLEAYVRQRSDSLLSRSQGEQKLYRDFRGKQRDLSCLLLADLSLSTDAWINDNARIIDVIKDSLYLFTESLHACGDQFALYGFSSDSRHDVQFQTIKAFDEKYQADIHRRIDSLKPQNYTRMGAAIRRSTQLLAAQKSEQRLLLLLTDGKPNDIDIYEGRYGVEDTRMSLIEARRQGLQVFCITIDQQANDYLPHIFGQQRYVLIRNPAELPREVPLLYLHLTSTY